MTPHRLVRFAIVATLGLTLAAGVAACGAQAQAQPRQVASDLSATAVATHYFKILNAGMKSGNFSGMASVFASDATLTQPSPKGVTTVVHGLPAITHFYQTLATKLPGYQWTTESQRSLADNVVLAYEHAGSPPLHVPSRCVHVFDVQHGKIVRYDWATYFAGQP